MRFVFDTGVLVTAALKLQLVGKAHHPEYGD